MSGNRQEMFVAYRGDADFSSYATNLFYGTTYRARFSVSNPVHLTSVAFYGCKDDNDNSGGRFQEANFTKTQIKPSIPLAVSLEIRESMYYFPRKKDTELKIFLPKTVYKMDVGNHKRDSVFFVELPTPVKVPENVAFDICFELKGLDDEVYFHCLPKHRNVGAELKIGRTTVEVLFSSAQCAGFKFFEDT